MSSIVEYTEMKASEIFRSWLRHRGRSSDDWQAEVRKDLIEQQQRGVSRQEMVESLARQRYAEDLRDTGPVTDLGFFTWQLYTGAALFLVNHLLPTADEADAPSPSQQGDGKGKGRRVA